MKIYYSDSFVLPLPEGHRFPMEKYARLRSRVAEAGLVAPEDLRVPEPATDQELHRVHEPGYVAKVHDGSLGRNEIRRMGFPWSPALAERSRRSVGGTVAAARSAVAEGVSANLSGGTHHAFPERGEGFCVFNDVAVAARAAQAEGLARRVSILDLDVHQGNGTAAIFSDDPTVVTVSVHGADNYPFRKERSDLDIELPDEAGDAPYLEAVERAVAEAIQSAGPDLVIFLAGADPYEGDRLGRLKVSKNALVQRDELVFSRCRAQGVPVAVAMGGGYAHRIDDAVDIHFHTVQAAARILSGPEPSQRRS
jgi:acetoin utilization deacetylase AcuC-like enzyme